MSAWLPEDRALDARLSDEALFERVFRAATAGVEATLPHPRASGVLALLRARRPELAGASAETWAGALAPERLQGLSAPLLHHLHVLSSRIAEVLGDEHPERAIEARVISLSAWHALVREGAYLRELATRVLGAATAAPDVERALAAAEFEPLDAQGREARTGARQLVPAAGRALRVVARAEDVAERAGLEGSARARLVTRARSLEAAAVGEALAPVEQALAAASARGDGVLVQARALEQAIAAWRWAGEAEQIEQFVVDALTPLAWQVSRERRWRDLGALLGPFDPLVEGLCARVESDTRRIAYAAPCAQMLVFRYESERELARGIAALERGVRLCATHRNARVMLAWALCDRAIATMSDTVIAYDEPARRRVEADLARAEQLWPTTSRLADARARLSRALGGR